MADTAAGLTRLESFPFDSKLDGYDDYGYPVYDRAVGAAMLRATFRQFFSDGVFGTPPDAFDVRAGEGLSVTVQPGIAVVRGSMGGVDEEPARLQLDSEAPKGAVTYAVMLRYDENDEYRSLYLRVAKGEAGGAAPEPDVTSPGVRELRLGTVAVPSGATDLSGATIRSDKGSDLCPYAAPFERIDVSALFDQLRADGQDKLEWFQRVIDQYKGLLDSALGDSVAAELQRQITELRVGMTDAEFVAYVTGGA